MIHDRRELGWKRWRVAAIIAAVIPCWAALAQIVPTTMEDFHLSGAQIGDAQPADFESSHVCSECHGFFDEANSPYST